MSYASETVTDSVYDFEVYDDYGVMPLAVPTDTVYHSISGRYTQWNDRISYNYGSYVLSSDFRYKYALAHQFDTYYYSDALPVWGFGVSGAGLGSVGDTVRIVTGGLGWTVQSYGQTTPRFFDFSNPSFYDMWAEIDYTGTYKKGNSFVSASATKRVQISPKFSEHPTGTFGYGGVDVSIYLEEPTELKSAGQTITDFDSYNGTVNQIRVFFIPDKSAIRAEDGSGYGSGTSGGSYMAVVSGRYSSDGFGQANGSDGYSLACNVFVSEGSGDSTSNMLGSLANSITNSTSKLSQQLNTGFTKVQNTLSQMSSDISTGFNNMIQSAKENTQNIITTISDKTKEIKDSIVELPEKIGNKILELFVPAPDDLTEYKDKWDELLSDRFGVVYESGTLILDTVQTITAQSASPTIEFPEVSYNFSGTPFTFGGYNVDVVPDGFEFFVDILKTLIDIVVTLAFVNGMRNKYDELIMR